MTDLIPRGSEGQRWVNTQSPGVTAAEDNTAGSDSRGNARQALSLNEKDLSAEPVISLEAEMTAVEQNKWGGHTSLI